MPCRSIGIPGGCSIRTGMPGHVQAGRGVFRVTDALDVDKT